jgi:hypothetical protein
VCSLYIDWAQQAHHQKSGVVVYLPSQACLC